MGRYYSTIMISAFFVSAFTHGMNNNNNNKITVVTSDKKICKLPQWKIESSRLLHTKQQFNKAFKKNNESQLVLKTITKHQLNLFSYALDAIDFNMYFKKHAQSKQRLRNLICVAGKEKLDSPLLTALLVHAYFNRDFIVETFCTHIPEIATIVSYLRESIIVDNCTHNRYTQTTQNYLPNSHILSDGSSYHCIPKSITNFNGYSPLLTTTILNDIWIMHNYHRRDDETSYLITPIDPLDLNNRPKPEPMRV